MFTLPIESYPFHIAGPVCPDVTTVEGGLRLSGTISDLLILNVYLLAITFLGNEPAENSSCHIQHQEKSGENSGELVVMTTLY